ncbi:MULTISPECIES: flagellar hook-associated protein FlgK [Xenorhabdus]|uniref:Flagellar hook-associated protein 1 n=1 Tax=Xenorhabdus ehlersii TaxID=290111 RepID=A0A2D0IWY3_9GAMM|nr:MULTISPECIES: flagellar hook-associated protein FlgK [Xenorhabdus]MBC8950406.1 flagellar hook-associated protein 1 FlgK [Xenorhabdus sp. TS4]PHM26278.1 flagellar hook-associated protein 1 FlgK [Xenorhabdus ehlersii]RKE91529.1 flagellar hook-associated protein 1 FlgK [Xenorhabdus ehlersii]
MSNSLINTAMSGINAAQVAMSVVSNNITNSKVEGYHRQITVMSQNNGNMSPVGFIGNGVNVNSIDRQYNEFVNEQYNAAKTKYAELITYNNQASQVENLLADNTTSLSSSMEDFFKSLSTLENNAEDHAARTTVRGKAEGLVNRFKETDQHLRKMDSGINTQIEKNVKEINKYAEEIAFLNNEISRMRGVGTGEPLALLDKRDDTLNKLNQLIEVDMVQQDGGVYNVSFGGGPSLVLGSKSYRLEAIPSSADSGRITLGYNNGISTKEIDERFISQGTLGGALRVRSEVIDPTRNQLNQLGLVMADQFNQVQRGGFDLDGKPGIDFFNLAQPETIANSNNKGSAEIKVEYADTTKVKDSDYTIKYQGGDWKVQRVTDKEMISVTKNGKTLEFDGLKVAINATNPQDNDRYTLKTVGSVIATLEVNIKTPSQLATAGAKGSGQSDNNNAKKFTLLQEQKLVDGKNTLTDAYASLVSTVGSKANSSQRSFEAQKIQVEVLYSRRESISGVNLDEEYGELQRLQQYYLSNARVIQTASTLFNAILDIR